MATRLRSVASRGLPQKGEDMSSRYSIGQMNLLAASLEAAGYTPEDITKLGWTKNLQKILKVVRGEAKIVEIAGAIETKKPKVYLRRLFETEAIVVDATDGVDDADTFAGSGVFPGGVYGLAVPPSASPTPAFEAAVYEQTADGKFADVLGSLGVGRLRWREAQVVAFCRKHRGKLRTARYATFFEMVGGFVAIVRSGDHARLGVGVDPFSSADDWAAGNSFVVPL